MCIKYPFFSSFLYSFSNCHRWVISESEICCNMANINTFSLKFLPTANRLLRYNMFCFIVQLSTLGGTPVPLVYPQPAGFFPWCVRWRKKTSMLADWFSVDCIFSNPLGCKKTSGSIGIGQLCRHQKSIFTLRGFLEKNASIKSIFRALPAFFCYFSGIFCYLTGIFWFWGDIFTHILSIHLPPHK